MQATTTLNATTIRARSTDKVVVAAAIALLEATTSDTDDEAEDRDSSKRKCSELRDSNVNWGMIQSESENFTAKRPRIIKVPNDSALRAEDTKRRRAAESFNEVDALETSSKRQKHTSTIQKQRTKAVRFAVEDGQLVNALTAKQDAAVAIAPSRVSAREKKPSLRARKALKDAEYSYGSRLK